MRNLLEYPITKEEMLKALDEAIRCLSEKYKGMVGCIAPAALWEAKAIIEKQDDPISKDT